jgi:outer membrane protein
MKRILTALLAIVFLCAPAVPSLAAKSSKQADRSTSSLKVGVYDMQRIMAESKVIREYRKLMEKEIEEKRNILAGKQEALIAMDDRLKKEGEKMSLSERQRLGEKLHQGLKELQRLREDLDIELQKKDRELGQRAMQEIAKVIRSIGEKEGYEIIFEKSAAGITYLKGKHDITRQIIRQYDEQR